MSYVMWVYVKKVFSHRQHQVQTIFLLLALSIIQTTKDGLALTATSTKQIVSSKNDQVKTVFFF